MSCVIGSASAVGEQISINGPTVGIAVAIVVVIAAVNTVVVVVVLRRRRSRSARFHASLLTI